MRTLLIIVTIIAASYYGYTKYFSNKLLYGEIGTLHEESLQSWTKASKANQMATSADFATLLSPKSKEELVEYTEGIFSCINEFVKIPNEINNTVSEAAKICIKMRCLIDAENCELLKKAKQQQAINNAQ